MIRRFFQKSIIARWPLRKDEPRARVAALTVPGRAFRRADAWLIWFGEGWEVRRDDGMRLSRQTLGFCDEALQRAPDRRALQLHATGAPVP